MSLPKIASKHEWLAARRELLAQEKEFSRQRDVLSAARRQLPMVKIEKEYRFDGPHGAATLLDLFDGQRQLIVYHFMFDPGWGEGCKHCSCVMDGISGSIVHLGARDTAFAAISRAPFEKIEAFKQRMGWPVPWYSSFGNDFNYDFQVTLDSERGDYLYNYASVAALIEQGKIFGAAHPNRTTAARPSKGEMPGLSVFLRVDDSICHTYSTYMRGLDLFIGMYNLLDVTPLGRQEEDGCKFVWVRHHDKYGPQVAAS